MKKLTLIAALFAVTGIANAQTAQFGGSGEVQFNGKINTDACTINGGSSQTVNLGEVTASQVLPTGTALQPSNSKRFVIDVVCSNSDFEETDPTANPVVTLTFQPMGTSGSHLALGAPNTAGNGNTVAGGVAIALAKGEVPASMDMSNASQIAIESQPSAVTPGTYSYVFYANYIATVTNANSIRGGDANAILPFVLSYQ